MSKVREWGKVNQNKIWAWLIGIGLVFFAIHNINQPLKEYAFLPVLGLSLSLLVMMLVLSDNWRHLDFGSKWLWIPLVCIGGSIAVSGFVNGGSWGERSAPFFFACYLFGIYLVGRILKDDLFAPFSLAVIVAAVGCVVYGVMYPGQMTGGVISPPGSVSNPIGNYDIAAGLLIFGVVIGVWKWRWWLSAVALVGLFFCGAPEGLFGVGILALVVLLKRDWSKKILLPMGVLAVAVVIWFSLGYGQQLYDYTAVTASNITNSTSTVGNEVSGDYQVEEERLTPLAYRWQVIKDAMSDIKPFGHGYSITHFTTETVHIVPITAIDQVGILAGVAWLFVTVYCLVKTKWKYAWAAVAALAVFDHYLWTQVAPWWWVLVGVSTVSTAKRDYIFKVVKGGSE